MYFSSKDGAQGGEAPANKEIGEEAIKNLYSSQVSQSGGGLVARFSVGSVHVYVWTGQMNFADLVV